MSGHTLPLPGCVSSPQCQRGKVLHLRSGAERHGSCSSDKANGISPKWRVRRHIDQAEVGGRLVAGARISAFRVIVLIPAPRAAPEVPSQPSALIWVEGQKLESAFVDGEGTIGRKPSADPVQDSVGTSRKGGRDALKEMLAWGSPPTVFWSPFGTLKSKVCVNQNGLLKGLASLPGPTHEKPEPVSVGQHFKCSFYCEQKHFPGKSILIIQPRLGGHPAHPK